jgi:hypothetical protein
MSNALEQFRAQRKAAEEVHDTLLRTAALLEQLRQQAAALSSDRELLAVLQAERSWLLEARETVAAVRSLREDEMRRYWPGIWRRWAVALVFALWSAFLAGSGYALTRQTCSSVQPIGSGDRLATNPRPSDGNCG